VVMIVHYYRDTGTLRGIPAAVTAHLRGSSGRSGG